MTASWAAPRVRNTSITTGLATVGQSDLGRPMYQCTSTLAAMVSGHTKLHHIYTYAARDYN